MLYGLIVVDAYVYGITINIKTEYPITKTEYNNFLNLFKRKPKPPEGWDYYLRYDTLEWELVEMPVNTDYDMKGLDTIV